MSMHKKPLTKLEHDGLLAHGLDIGTPSQLSDVFRQGIAFALANAPTIQREGWVSVEDRLPEEFDSYIVVLKSGAVLEFNFSPFAEVRWFKVGVGEESKDNPITHWQPLPAAPTDKE